MLYSLSSVQVVIREKAEKQAADDASALKNAASNLRLSSNLYPSLTIGHQKLQEKSAETRHVNQDTPAGAPECLLSCCHAQGGHKVL